jgi:hypothetical protein
MHLSWNFTFFCEICKFGSGGVFQWGQKKALPRVETEPF